MITALVLATLAIVATTCLVSLMVLFVSGDLGGPDLAGLAAVQLLSIPASLAIVAFVVALFVSASGRRAGLRRLWNATPQWLVFAYVVLNSLTLSGELAMAIMHRAMERDIPIYHHMPMLALLATTTAFLALYARMQAGRGAVLSGRWSPPDGPGTRGEPWEEDGF
jgi:hypothetical protein